MRLAAISDLHGHLPETPESDVLVIAGDLVPFDLVRDLRGQAAWLDGPFREWLGSLSVRPPSGMLVACPAHA